MTVPLCLTLAVSLAIVPALCLVAWLLAKLRPKSAHWSYTVHAVALVLSVISLPITYTAQQSRETAPQQARASEASPTSLTNAPQESALVTTPEVDANDWGIAAIPQAAGHEFTSAPAAATHAAPDEAGSPTWTPRNWTAWAPWIVALYAVGVLAMLARLVLAFWHAQQLAARGKFLRAGPLFDVLRNLQRQHSLRTAPLLAMVDAIVIPKVVGVLRPTILLPTSAVAGLTTDELEMILAHELAHIRRLDMWVNLVQRLAEAVLFFNPALWYLSRRVSTLREYCCDESACAAIQDRATAPRRNYAQALLRVVELATGPTVPGNRASADNASTYETVVALAASGRSPSELRRRVARLLGEPVREPIQVTRGGIMAVVAAALLMFAGPAVWRTQAETPREETQAATDHDGDSATIRKLAGGGQIELLAIGNHGPGDESWWDASGHSLDRLPFTTLMAGNIAPLPNRQLVFRIRDLPADANVRWEVEPASNSASATVVVDGKEKPAGYYSHVFNAPADGKPFRLKVGVTTGPWQKFAENAGGLMGMGKLGMSVVISDALVSERGGAVFVVSHNFNNADTRLVAIGREGERHATSRVSKVSAGPVNQQHYTFPDLKPEEIARVEFQARTYDWVEFENLPGNPGDVRFVDRVDEKLLSGNAVTQLQSLANVVRELSQGQDSGISSLANAPGNDATNQALRKVKFESTEHYVIDSHQQLLESFAQRFDAIAGYDEALDGVLEGLEVDPYGPRIDVRQLFHKHLGNRLTIAKGARSAGGHVLLAWAVDNSEKFSDALKRFAKTDPNSQLVERDGVVAHLPNDGEFGIAVTREHLLVASDRGLLTELIAGASPDEASSIVADRDKQTAPRLQFVEARRLATPEEIEAAKSNSLVTVAEWSPQPGQTETLAWPTQGAVLLTENDVDDATVTAVPSDSRHDVELTFLPAGSERFEHATSRLAAWKDQQAVLAVVFDGKVLMAPKVQEAIRGNKATISGSFTKEEAERIVEAIRPQTSRATGEHVEFEAIGAPATETKVDANGEPSDTNEERMLQAHSDNAEDARIEAGADVVAEPRRRQTETPGEENEEITALAELVGAYQQVYKSVEALNQAGAEGGGPANVALARYALFNARAELAAAKGDRRQSVAHYEDALDAAEAMVAALQAVHRQGAASLGDVLDASAVRAKAKVALSRAKSAARSAGPPAARNSAEKRARWLADLLRLTEHNQTAFAVGPRMIFQLTPGESWSVAKQAWPDIQVDEVKTGLLKTFEFARHPRVLDVLDLGATDDSQMVRDYAYRYLGNYSFRDFKKQGNDYAAWRETFAGQPTEKVLAANSRWYVEQLRDRNIAVEDVDWLFKMDDLLNLGGSKSSYPSKASYLRDAGLLKLLQQWRDSDVGSQRVRSASQRLIVQLNTAALKSDHSHVGAKLRAQSLVGLRLDKGVDHLLAGADMRDCDLSGATLVGGGKAFYGADLSGADLTGATLIGEAAFQRAKFNRAALDDGAGLQLASFDGAKLQNARISGGGSALQSASFKNADLRGARLQGGGASLQRANFDGANLTRAAIACNHPTSFQGAILNGANFASADLSTIDRRALESCEFDPATPPTYSPETKFPTGFDPQKNGWRLHDK